MHAYLLSDAEAPFVFSRLAYDQLIDKCECWSGRHRVGAVSRSQTKGERLCVTGANTIAA